MADEYLVHNLEHGHVVISYDCSKLADCEGTKTQIRQLIQRYDTGSSSLSHARTPTRRSH